MKKRIMSVAIAALLIVSMCVPAYAKRVFIQTSPNGGGYWGIVPDDNNDSSSSSSSSSGSNSSSSSSSSSGAAASGQEAQFTTPTGQPITDSLIAVLGTVTDSKGATAPVSKNTLIAYSKYLKALGLNAALVAAFVPTGDPGPTTTQNNLIVKGFSYTVLIQHANGYVEFVQPTSVDNGKIAYNRPAGAIASVAIIANAAAPK